MDIFKDFAKMPTRMKRLGWVQFFSWFALFTMWVYMTTGVAQNAYEVEIDQDTYAYFLKKFEEKKVALNRENSAAEKQKFMEKYDKFTMIEPKDGKYYMVSSMSSYLSQGFLVSENVLFDEVKNKLSFDTSRKGKELYDAMLQNEKYNNILVPFATLKHTLTDTEKQNQDSAMLLKIKEINSQNEAAGNWVGSLFGIYNFAAIPFAFLLIPLARRTSRKFVHILALICGGLGLLSFLWLKNSEMMIIPMIGIGFAWASILAMPYALLVDAIPLKKMGVYMGIFNFFIVIPQIINGLIGGSIVGGLFNDYAIYYVGLGGLSMIIAALLTFRIREPLFGEEMD